MKWSGSARSGRKSVRDNLLLASKFETTRKLESEGVVLSVKIICNLFREIIVSSGAVN